MFPTWWRYCASCHYTNKKSQRRGSEASVVEVGHREPIKVVNKCGEARRNPSEHTAAPISVAKLLKIPPSVAVAKSRASERTQLDPMTVV